jgi:hypothetical protein
VFAQVSDVHAIFVGRTARAGRLVDLRWAMVRNTRATTEQPITALVHTFVDIDAGSWVGDGFGVRAGRAAVLTVASWPDVGSARLGCGGLILRS